jgi:hypothetical protein
MSVFVPDDITGAPQTVDHPLEFVDVGNADPGQSVRATRDGEDCLDLGDVGGDPGNGVDPRAAREPDFRQRFKRPSQLGVVDSSRVAEDHAGRFEAVYPPLHCRRGQTDSGPPDRTRPTRDTPFRDLIR